MAAFVCANFVVVVLLSWMPSFVYEKFHLSLAMAGLTATLFVQVASMAGSAAGGWLADRMQRSMFCGRVVAQAAGGSALRGAVCGGLRADGIGAVVNRGADGLGLFQGAVRRQHIRFRLRCGAGAGAGRGGGIHEHSGVGGRRSGAGAGGGAGPAARAWILDRGGFFGVCGGGWDSGGGSGDASAYNGYHKTTIAG